MHRTAAAQLLRQSRTRQTMSLSFPLFRSGTSWGQGEFSSTANTEHDHRKFINDIDPALAPTIYPASTGSASSLEELLAANLKELPDPFAFVRPQVRHVASNLKAVLGGSGAHHPALTTATNYYFDQEGKAFRPTIVLLMSRATALHTRPVAIDHPLDDTMLLDKETWNHSAEQTPDRDDSAYDILPSQRRLAEITELIHVGSLVHDDVIDDAATRRGAAAAGVAHGNKLAVLAGDFILARASVSLARLRSFEVMELFSAVIAHFAEGEVMQAKATASDAVSWQYYMRKTFCKTASLIAASTRSAALLGGHDESIVEAATEYGRQLGLAFQIMDDVLDFTSSAETLGKPAASDLTSGNITAPVLFALDASPNNAALHAAAQRKFKGEGDVDLALQAMKDTDALEKARDLAQAHAASAIAALEPLLPSSAKQALIGLAGKVVNRSS